MANPGSPNVFFAFGPSQSFVAWDWVYSTSKNLSSELSTLLSTENIKNLNFVVLLGGPNGGNTITQAYIGYHKKHGLKSSGLLYSPPIGTAKLLLQSGLRIKTRRPKVLKWSIMAKADSGPESRRMASPKSTTKTSQLKPSNG
jgi:hypothetical protein